MAVEHGYSYEEVGARLGVSGWSVRRWVTTLRESGELPAKETTAPVADDLKALREENRQLRLENEILKKATAYFARDSL
jgi:transposase